MSKSPSRSGRLKFLKWILPAALLLVLYLAPVFDLMAPLVLDRSAHGNRETTGRGQAAPAVILISIDGLAPYVQRETDTPTLDRIAREGTRARLARTIDLSMTMASHASMITGLDSATHGLTWNRFQPWSHVTVFSVFSACREQGLRCGLVAGKRKLAHFAVDEPGVEFWAYGEDAQDVFARALSYLRRRDPDFLMIHLAEVDLAGHAAGWGSERQLSAIRTIDGLLGSFLEAALETGGPAVQLIVTADHGGHGRGHLSGDPRDREIPWIAWGSGIAQGRVVESVSTLDTAQTILSLLAVPIPEAMQGEVVALSQWPWRSRNSRRALPTGLRAHATRKGPLEKG